MPPEIGMSWQEGLAWFGAILAAMVAGFAAWGAYLLRDRRM